jgi:phosphoribosylaminoimidazole-succinocarboxamide synthase
MQKQQELYRGKAKTVYTTEDENRLVLEFRNDTSAFDGQKVEQLARKGMVNNKFNHFIMEKLEAAGIPTQVEKLLSDNESLVKKLDMIPVECVVRNIAAGSICRRLGIEEGRELTPPTFEFFLKNDELHDPMVNEYHVESFGWATKEQISRMKELTFMVNDVLKVLFDEAGMLLVDYKLEFGVFNDEIVLGDEFTPDGCRLWDKATREKLDKDRFRQGLGGVVEAYEEVAHRLGVKLD